MNASDIFFGFSVTRLNLVLYIYRLPYIPAWYATMLSLHFFLGRADMNFHANVMMQNGKEE